MGEEQEVNTSSTLDSTTLSPYTALLSPSTAVLSTNTAEVSPNTILLTLMLSSDTNMNTRKN